MMKFERAKEEIIKVISSKKNKKELIEGLNFSLCFAKINIQKY